jgi:NAD(P)-dependent dehydrogenase (short-subunit alcohol dehydrogenase family)
MELSITRVTGFFGSQVAREREGRDIRINPVAPGAGSIVTAILNALGLTKGAVDEWTEHTATEIALKRFGQPHGVAAIAAFLASHDASYITGVEFNVDGGLGQF